MASAKVGGQTQGVQYWRKAGSLSSRHLEEIARHNCRLKHNDFDKT